MDYWPAIRILEMGCPPGCAGYSISTRCISASQEPNGDQNGFSSSARGHWKAHRKCNGLTNCGSRTLVSADFLFQVGNAKIGFAITKFFGGLPGKAGITAFNLVEFALGKLFDVEHGIVASFRGAQ